MQRRQGGKVETHSDLASGREASEVEEVVIAVASTCERQAERRLVNGLDAVHSKNAD